MSQVRTLSFASQNIYCGIDVHKKDWSVCIRDDSFELKTFSQPPKAETLVDFLKKNYACLTKPPRRSQDSLDLRRDLRALPLCSL